MLVSSIRLWHHVTGYKLKQLGGLEAGDILALAPVWPCGSALGDWFLLILQGLLGLVCMLVSSIRLWHHVTGYKLKQLGGLESGGHSGTGTFLALW
jgi:hypothetical protein